MYFDVFGPRGLAEALDAGAAGIKIHASDLQNRTFLQEVSKSEAAVLLGIGGSTLNEIREALELLPTARICLMLGHQGYPTPVSENNLARLHSLSREFANTQLGFAEHSERGDPIGLWLAATSIGAGASLVEKHLTLSAEMLDSDAALLPAEFAAFVTNMRMAAAAFGHTDESRDDLGMGPSEIGYREMVRKHVVATRDLPEGTVIEPDDITLKRSGAESGEAILAAANAMGRSVLSPVQANCPITRANLGPSALSEGRKLAAVLACRVTGTRLYGKPLQALLEGTSILEQIVSALRTFEIIDEIVLAVAPGQANQPFVDLAGLLRCDAVVGHPEDVLARLIQGAEHVSATDVFRVTTECPFFDYERLDEAWARHIERKSDATVLDLVPLGTGFEIYTLESLITSHEQGRPEDRSEYCSNYMRFNQAKFAIDLLPPRAGLDRTDLRLTVDYPEDLVVCRAVSAELEAQLPRIRLADAIRFLDRNPQLKELVEPWSGSPPAWTGAPQ